MKFLKPIAKSLSVAVAVAAIAACNVHSEVQEESNQAAIQMPLPQVTVAPVLYETVTEWSEFTGRLEAAETVDVRPRVSGTVVNVAFEEGAMVKKGDLLFEIDARPFEAEVDRLMAELKAAKSRVDLAKSDYQRALRLQNQSAISEEQVDNRLAQRDQAVANKEALEAALESALLELSFTHIKAPIDGRVSSALITAGNFVNAGQSHLTTLVSTDRIHAYFDADEQTFLAYQQQVRRTAERISGNGADPVFMRLANESEYQHLGYIDFVDNRVDPTTGTIRARAVFDNSKQQFTPGLFTRIKLAVNPQVDAVLIKDQAIGTDLNNKYVLVLTEDSRVEYRPVELGPKIEGLRMIRNGLHSQDRIVINGLQRVRPGSQVDAQAAAMATEQTLARIAEQQRIVAQGQQALQPMVTQAVVDATPRS